MNVQLQLRLFVAGKETADGNETTSEFMASVNLPITFKFLNG
jgi:hypothetical protein